MLKSVMDSLGRLSVARLYLLSCVVLGVVAAADYATGPDLALSIFYLFPMLLVSWFVGRRAGNIASLICIAAWLAMDRTTSPTHLNPVIPLWNASVRLGYFLIINNLLWMARESWEHERQHARVDALTGVSNARWFKECVQREIERAERYGHPIAIGYFDADNFKRVNDRFGHDAGDEVLQKIGETLRAQIRNSDVAGRLGGDEFAVLLTETPPEKAKEVIERVAAALKSVGPHNDIVSMSIGLVCFSRVQWSYDEIVRIADNLMYRAKGEGKDRIEVQVDPTADDVALMRALG